MTTVEQAKHQGMINGLESELGLRMNTMRDAYEKKNWLLVRSTSLITSDLAEELRKLNEVKPNEP